MELLYLVLLTSSLLIHICYCNKLYQEFKVTYGDDETHCTNHMHKFYRRLKCQPERTPGGKCPTSYDCPTLTARSKEHCYYEGIKYPVGTNITHETVNFHNRCLKSCQCVRLYEGVRFVCIHEAQIKTCPGSSECQRFAFLEDFPCCEMGVSSCKKSKNIVTCKYNGQHYNEGEKIIASQDPTCTQCICAAGFNGTVSSNYCRELSCSLEFWGDAPIMLSRGCIPFFLSQEGCCPTAFRCPKATDQVVKQKSTVNQSVKKCVFGNLTMDVGDHLSVWGLGNGDKVDCSCQIPPWPSCVAKNLSIAYRMKRELAQKDSE